MQFFFRMNREAAHLRTEGNPFFRLLPAHGGKVFFQPFPKQQQLFLRLPSLGPAGQVEGRLRFELPEKFQVNGFRDVRRKRSVQLQDGEKGVVQGVLGRPPGVCSLPFCRVEPFLCQFDIGVAKIVPEEAVDFVPCLAGLIIAQLEGSGAQSFVGSGKNPPVSGKQRRARRKRGKVFQ